MSSFEYVYWFNTENLVVWNKVRAIMTIGKFQINQVQDNKSMYLQYLQMYIKETTNYNKCLIIQIIEHIYR